MVTYVLANSGKHFVITELGMEKPHIRAKYERKSKRKNAYESAVPKVWLTSGYVKEVENDG